MRSVLRGTAQKATVCGAVRRKRGRAALPIAAIVASWTASCAAPADQPLDGHAVAADQLRVERLADGTVWLRPATEAQVVAYVSMARREVYVDHDYRDRASWLLNAHISVSTWHWRIPLPGDEPGVPITPGDAVREFEELDISLWDRSGPTMDDIRIVRAEAVGAEWAPGCAEVQSGPGESAEAVWLAAHVETIAAEPSESGTIREDFRLLGPGEIHRDSDCAGAGESVPVVGWSRRPEG